MVTRREIKEEQQITEGSLQMVIETVIINGILSQATANFYELNEEGVMAPAGRMVGNVRFYSGSCVISDVLLSTDIGPLWRMFQMFIAKTVVPPEGVEQTGQH